MCRCRVMRSTVELNDMLCFTWLGAHRQTIVTSGRFSSYILGSVRIRAQSSGILPTVLEVLRAPEAQDEVVRGMSECGHGSNLMNNPDHPFKARQRLAVTTPASMVHRQGLKHFGTHPRRCRRAEQSKKTRNKRKQKHNSTTFRSWDL